MQQRTGRAPAVGGGNDALWDLVQGFLSWRLWAFFALHDIRQRYRRSSFGPLWLALGLGVTVIGIGLLYSQILKAEPGTFIPYLAISLLVWNFIATMLMESVTLFAAAAGPMSSVRFPYSSMALRAIARNMIVFAHCIPPAAIAFIFYRYPVDLTALWSIPGLLLLLANMYWLALGIGLMCTRFRDLGQIVIYTTQLALFLTPIIWQSSQVRAGSAVLAFNPFYHLVELVRAPIFEHRVPVTSYIYCLAMLAVGGVVSLTAFAAFRRRLIHWL